MSRFAARLASFPRWLVLLGLIGAGAIFLGGVSRGFDFTDEGFYYLSFARPENVSDNQTSFYFFGARLFSLLGHNVVAMRLATLVASLGGAFVFLLGVRRFTTVFAPRLMPDKERWRLAQSSALVASFLGYAISPPALAYNFQNAFCLLAATGLLLSACAFPRSERLLNPRLLATLAGFGGLLGLEFFIKFSSSVPLAVAGVLVFLLVSLQSLRRKAGLAGLLLFCAVSVALIYFSLFQHFMLWWGGIAGTANAIVNGGYATGEIRRYGQEIAEAYAKTLRDFVPVWVVALPAVAVVAALRARPRWQRIAAALAGFWTLGHLLWLINEREYYSAAGSAGVPFFLGTLLLLMVFAASSRVAVPDGGQNCTSWCWRTLLAAGLFFILPYVGAFGTNNPIHLNCLYQLAPWFVIAAWLLAEIDRIWRTPWPSRLGLLLLAAVAGSQFYQGYWLHPYRAGGSRSEQTVPTEVGDPVSILRLTPEAHEFIVTSRRILHDHGFKPGDDLLVFFNLPGFVFAVGGQSPGHPWYNQGTPYLYELNLMRLRFIDPARRSRAFIVRNSVETDWNDFLPYLREAGLHFPEDYQLITPPMSSPLTRVPFEIWQPKPFRKLSAGLDSGH